MVRPFFVSCSLICSLFPVLFASPLPGKAGSAETGVGLGKIRQELAAIAYQGTETFRYGVSYTGGIHLGHLDLALKSAEGNTGRIEIVARVSTEGSFLDTIYPIDDTHLTMVEGEGRWPLVYEVNQQEGWSYTAHRLTRYEQTTGKVVYRKNENPEIIYEVEPLVHNEFSAFFASRLMGAAAGETFLVPTFADKRRSLVEVRVLARETLADTLLGKVDTLKVTPLLPFKGLYGKEGDTTIWYTADECRVPVRITSKITIGSITAELLSYQNPLCERYGRERGASTAD